MYNKVYIGCKNIVSVGLYQYKDTLSIPISDP